MQDQVFDTDDLDLLPYFKIFITFRIPILSVNPYFSPWSYTYTHFTSCSN